MKNIFEEDAKRGFSWEGLGDVKLGRGELGEEMPVIVYRLMQYTLLDVLNNELGAARSRELYRAAGHLAGTEFAANALDLSLDLNGFLAHLQETLKQMKIGILRMETFDADSGEFTLTVGEDLDCSGLPITNENVCVYDEGFISGIMESYTGKKYDVREVDCWASGARVCRFKGAPEG